MFKKILIANRGEIACRIMRTAHQMGIKTVAVYADPDRHALHVKHAGEAFALNGTTAKESYLNIDKLITIAKRSGAEAIHPGYGFLSEHADFATACVAAGLVWIGPPDTAILAMGNKAHAKRQMEQAGIPVLPGYHGEEQSDAFLYQAAEAMGYPVLIKAASGGGGKGMRLVQAAAGFLDALQSAKREALGSFADDRVILEKYLTQPRHIEVQIFYDGFGKGVYLFERDCSIQRRHQKIIEEAPAVGLSEALRQQLGEVALRVGAAIGYVGAGTVEFLMDCDGAFYFMEMNTRLQVEHPVTEMITHQDLVAWQFQVASGARLPCDQGDLKIQGHAVEARIYAENIDLHFLPSTGTVTHLQCGSPHAGIRWEMGIALGDEVSIYFDPLMAKVIAWGDNRTQAILRLSQALEGCYWAGVKHNIGLLVRILNHPQFLASAVTTQFIEAYRDDLIPPLEKRGAVPEIVFKYAALFFNQTLQSPLSAWGALDAWRPNYKTGCQWVLQCSDYGSSIASVPYSVHWNDIVGYSRLAVYHEGFIDLEDNGQKHRAYVFRQDIQTVSVFYHNERYDIRWLCLDDPSGSLEEEGEGILNAPMPGIVLKVHVALGNTVSRGDPLMVLEAMKMEHLITAPRAGIIAKVHYAQGDRISAGAELFVLEPLDSVDSVDAVED
jgi:3-methylcrotonyl-CoA carboxylase alpha subunit